MSIVDLIKNSLDVLSNYLWFTLIAGSSSNVKITFVIFLLLVSLGVLTSHIQTRREFYRLRLQSDLYRKRVRLLADNVNRHTTTTGKLGSSSVDQPTRVIIKRELPEYVYIDDPELLGFSLIIACHIATVTGWQYLTSKMFNQQAKQTKIDERLSLSNDPFDFMQSLPSGKHIFTVTKVCEDVVIKFAPTK